MGKKLLPLYKVELQEDDTVPHWYVMMVQYQDKYADTIMQRVKNMGLEHFILETLIPTKIHEETIQDAKGKLRKIKHKEPIWPTNYLLIHMIMNSNTWSICRNTSYAMGWLNADGRPKVIADSEVVALREMCGMLTDIKQSAVEFKGKIGDRVKIINHIFVGKEARVIEVEGDVSVILENGFKLILEPYQLELLN